ncbi:SusD/RagB family nutrient-binding outer membrane lipoprotein [Sphingobacterium lactis]|uniref:Starch-binding associating with outer membrane n=1 Tax=Sphingobacterium lactis TaxID=797291 RepID=A0A1H6B621_9SPHI|nr:SusD/RagB family nutrient-binding outer membrane lipoprotein [Sphingobacterium lactis]SEG55845.1 Starch-binding associating with outer membrane [Sphingobacterium lactis]
MKIKNILLLLLGITFLTSCDKDFVEMNINPTTQDKALPHMFMNNALINAVTYNMNRNRNFNNELMQVTVSIGDGDGKVFRYDFRRSWSDYTWNNHYLNMSNIKDIHKTASEELNYNRSYQGVSLILQAWVYSILTDTYGDIPYTQSTLGRDSLLFEPKFDLQKDIYVDLLNKLDTANTLLKANDLMETGSDPIYKGAPDKWRKFGNSLYLRLLLRIVHKPEVQEHALAKIKEILETNASNYPIIASNEESAILRWTGVDDFKSPFMATRVQDFRASAISEFFMDFLRDTNDPRINIPEYGTSGINRWGIAPVSGSFVGVPSGYAAGTEDYSKMSYFYSADQNKGVNSLQVEPLTGMIMNFSEVEFIKSEAMLKGYISGDPKTPFYSGIESNIRLWIPEWKSNAKDHLVASDIDWNDADTFEQKMERIHKQKYLALFLVDNQQWFEYRRTGHPVLPKGPGLQNNGEMPARMAYPVYVQSSNPTSYKEAIARQGADEINTKVWWQKP